jgi:hypothetical protein
MEFDDVHSSKQKVACRCRFEHKRALGPRQFKQASKKAELFCIVVQDTEAPDEIKQAKPCNVVAGHVQEIPGDVRHWTDSGDLRDPLLDRLPLHRQVHEYEFGWIQSSKKPRVAPVLWPNLEDASACKGIEPACRTQRVEDDTFTSKFCPLARARSAQSETGATPNASAQVGHRHAAILFGRH